MGGSIPRVFGRICGYSKHVHVKLGGYSFCLGEEGYYSWSWILHRFSPQNVRISNTAFDFRILWNTLSLWNTLDHFGILCSIPISIYKTKKNQRERVLLYFITNTELLILREWRMENQNRELRVQTLCQSKKVCWEENGEWRVRNQTRGGSQVKNLQNQN